MTTGKTLEFLGKRRMKPWTYPDSYAIIKPASLMAEQANNRDSASWKKAEYVVIDEVQHDQGERLIPLWCDFTAADPDGAGSIQKLLVNIGGGQFAMYNHMGLDCKIGTLRELVK